MTFTTKKEILTCDKTMYSVVKFNVFLVSTIK